MAEFQTLKSDIRQARLVSTDAASADALTAGQVLVGIERFALTANNITYGSIGDMLGYWKFFPPTDGSEADGWGLIPAWGFAHVLESRHSAVAVGTRLYGFFPMADRWVLTPGEVSDQRIVDATPHRAELPPVYNAYLRVNHPADPQRDGLQSLLNPLFGTSFCLCDALDQADFHGAQQIAVLSASSKTSIGLAWGLNQIDPSRRPRMVGLTASANARFVQSLALYDQVVTYDAVTAFNAELPTVIVDMSGNRSIMVSLHRALGDSMRWSHQVGLTHWQDDSTSDGIISERSGLFFAPGHIEQRVAELGPDVWQQRLQTFMHGGINHAAGWLTVDSHAGLAATDAVYQSLLGGETAPNRGQVIAPGDTE